MAEIDAKVGGFGIVPDELAGAIVSSHYFLYELDESAIDKRYLAALLSTDFFQKQVQAQGSTNYAAIRPAHVLAYKIPLPSLDEQREIVAMKETLENLGQGLARASQEARSLSASAFAMRLRITDPD